MGFRRTVIASKVSIKHERNVSGGILPQGIMGPCFVYFSDELR